jgi:hypothetical protein
MSHDIKRPRDNQADTATLGLVRSVNFWLVTTQVFSTLMFMLFTGFTINELRQTNDLTRRQQSLTLRPYLSLQEVRTIQMNKAATPEERWLVSAMVTNTGSLPARDVSFCRVIDTSPGNDSLAAKPDGILGVLNTGSSAVISITISKREVLDMFQEAGGVFFHIEVRYKDQEDRFRELVATSTLNYEAGKVLVWYTTDLSMN